MKQIKILLLAAICFALAGTTYVVKEGGREVGRYEEADGKTEIVESNNPIHEKVPIAAPTSKPVKPAASAASAPGEVKYDGPGNAAFQRLQAEAEKMVATVKQKNDARHAESERAIKEMEDGYK